MPVRKARFLGESSDIDIMGSPKGEIIIIYGGIKGVEQGKDFGCKGVGNRL